MYRIIFMMHWGLPSSKKIILDALIMHFPPSRNPRLKYLSNLYDDLQKVFQFQSVENLPQLIHSDPEEQQQSIQPGELENVSDEADYVSDSDSDSDEDPQSGEGDCIYSLI
jgi:hypothetical protein